MHEKGGVERVDEQIDFGGAVGLFPDFQAERALADVRAFGGSGLAVGGAGVDVAIVARSLDSEIPGRVEALEFVERSSVPIAGVSEGDLGVADEHGDIVGPGGHGTRNFSGFGGGSRERNSVREVAAKVDGGGIDDVLESGAELVLALGVAEGGDGEKEGNEKVSEFTMHT